MILSHVMVVHVWLFGCCSLIISGNGYNCKYLSDSLLLLLYISRRKLRVGRKDLSLQFTSIISQLLWSTGNSENYVSAKPYAYKSVHCILSLYIFLSWRMLVLLLGVPRYVACKAWRRVAFAQLWWRQSSQLLRGQNNLDPNLPIQISGQY